MKKSDLFRMIGKAVQAHPYNAKQHLQLQTFCVVRGRGEVNGESLSRSVVDRFKPYFYSRRWEAHGFTSDAIEYDFPAVFAIELPGTINGGPLNPRATLCTDIQLVCLYPNIEHLDDSLSARCNALLVQEIEAITLEHLVYIFKLIGTGVFAVTDKDPAGGWYLESELEYLEDQAEILTYTIDQAKTQSWKKRFEADNQQVAVDYIDDFTVHKLCGTSMTIRSCESLCSPSLATEFSSMACCAQP